ncbi:hyaluronan mediated motility receptor-like isoform X2 [Dermacentor albipictus]|uniref:hyaluronan mediated motility receptor-like isoform X2 n=1 Tax=Dermacentor albipictus TaxID=60249 RepID=UPI0031FD9D11
MSFPKAPRFPGSTDDVPPVGSYNPALEGRTPTPKFSSATRFRDNHAGSFSTPGGSFRMPPIPLHASKELLKRRLSEMAEHLEERDMLIGQLRVSKGKLATRVSQLEQLLRGLSRKVSAQSKMLGARKPKSCEASMTSRQDIEETQALLKELRETDMAEEAFCEVRLSKGTQELKEELSDMIDEMNADDAKASSTDIVEAYDQENASFKAKIFLLEEELKALRDMLASITTEKEEMEENVAKICTEKSSLRGIIKDIEAKCSELHQQVLCHKKQCAAKQAEIEQFVCENEVLKNKAQSFADCQQELNAILDRVKAEKHELKKKVAETCKENSSLKASIENLEAKHTELHHKLVCQENENTAKGTQIEQLVLENEVLKNKAQSLADCKQELNAILDDVKAEKHELEEKVAATCKENSSLKASIENLEAKHTELYHKLVCQERENTAKGTQVEQLVLENDVLKNKAQSLADCQQELNAILDHVKAEKHELEEKVAETCKKNSYLKACIENLEAKHTELHHKLVCQENENTAKGKQIEQLVLENEVLKNKAQSLTDCKQELNAILDRVKAEKHEFEEKVAETCKENSALKTSIENLEAKHTELHHELLCQKKENTAKGTQIEQLVLENEVLQNKAQSLADYKQELIALNDELAQVKFEKEEGEKRLAELHIEKTTVERSLEDLASNFHKLHQEVVQHQEEKVILNMKMEEIEKQNEVLKANVQILEDLKSKWEHQHLLLTDCIEDLQSKLDEAHCEEAELKSSVTLLHHEISIHEQLKQDMLKELEDFGDILTLNTSLEERLTSALVEVDSLRSRNSEFAKKMSALEDANRVAQNNISELLKERKQLEESIKSCQNIRNGIEVKLSDATRNLNSWKEKAEVLSCENRRRDEELTNCTQQLEAAVLRADKYKCVCSELDRQRRELRDQLKQLSEELAQVKDEQMNNLTEQLNSMAAEAERWKASFEALQMRVSPFQEQLELYELEKQLLERRNEATESELAKLHGKVSEMMGHQNHKQKIRYLSKLLKERDEYKKELYALRQKTLKQTKEIARLEVQLSQKLKQGQKSLFDQSAKENVLPKPPM